MSSGKVHRVAGILTGGMYAAIRARNQKPLDLALEVIGGAMGGRLGASLPDILEPAIHSHHRDFFHSVIFALGGGGLSIPAANKLVEKLRAQTNVVRAQARAAGARGDTQEQFTLTVTAALLLLFAGALNGAAVGYLSHVALDSVTPRSIPLLTRGF